MAAPISDVAEISDDARRRLLSALRAVLPRNDLLTSVEERRPYECDGLSAYRRLPLLVALPETVDQVCAVLKICHEQGVPVVARGAGTGLSGGALPLENGVLLSTAKLNRILSLDPINRVA